MTTTRAVCAVAALALLAAACGGSTDPVTSETSTPAVEASSPDAKGSTSDAGTAAPTTDAAAESQSVEVDFAALQLPADGFPGLTPVAQGTEDGKDYIRFEGDADPAAIEAAMVGAGWFKDAEESFDDPPSNPDASGAVTLANYSAQGSSDGNYSYVLFGQSNERGNFYTEIVIDYVKRTVCTVTYSEDVDPRMLPPEVASFFAIEVCGSL